MVDDTGYVVGNINGYKVDNSGNHMVVQTGYVVEKINGG